MNLLDYTLAYFLINIGEDQFGYGSDSYPNTISNALDYYCRAEGITATVGYSFWGITNAASELLNNRPTILFGSFTNPISGNNIIHTIVLYGIHH